MIDLERASRVFRTCRDQGLVDVRDTAVLFESFEGLANRLSSLRNAFPKSMLHSIAIKTNPQVDVLEFMVSNGFGLEAASFEELELADRAGAEGAQMIFDSPVKTAWEIRECLERWPGLHVNANSIAELDRFPEDETIRLGLRINPLAASNSPSLFDVSRSDSKFGVPISRRDELLEIGRAGRIGGLHVHCGSEISDIDAHASAIGEVVALADEINGLAGRRIIRWLDIGGGLSWQSGEAGMRRLSAALEARSPGLFSRYETVSEFGQWVHAAAGWVVSTVEYVERREGHADLAFVHVGADLFTRDVYSTPRDFRFGVLDSEGGLKQAPNRRVDLVGPLCFAGDVLARDRALPRLDPGDRLVILDAGANTYGLWSRHCSRSVPKIVGYGSGEIRVLAERSSISF